VNPSQQIHEGAKREMKESQGTER